MVQLGWNAGPWHAHVWGLAKSYCKKVDEEVMIDHDQEAIALVLCWSLAKANLPSKVMAHIEQCLEESGLPTIATRNVPEGMTLLQTQLCFLNPAKGQVTSWRLMERRTAFLTSNGLHLKVI